MLQVLVVCCCIISLVNAQLSGYMSPDELSGFTSRAKKSLLEPSSLSEAYHASRLLSVTKQKVIDCDCATLSKLIRTKKNRPLDVYYGLKAADACECDVKPLRSVEDDIVEDITNADVWTFGGAALAAKAMKIPVSLSAAEIVGKVSALMQPSGLFRSARGKLGSSNLENTKIALLVLSEFASSHEEVSDVMSTVSKLLSDSDNEKVSDPTLVRYLYAVSGKKPSMDQHGASSSARVFAVTETLIALRYSESIRDIADVVESLVIMQSYKSTPVYIGLDETQWKYGGKVSAKVEVRDAFGKELDGSSIEVLSSKRRGRDKDIFAGSLEGGALSLGGDLVPGFYDVNLSVILPQRTKPVLTTAVLTIAASLTIRDVSVGVNTDKKASDVDLSSVSAQNDWSGETAVASKNEYIHVTFAVSTPKKMGAKFQKPHQVFVKFSHVVSGVSSFFAASTSGTYSGKGAGNNYGVSVQLRKEVDTFFQNSGDYEVSILVGDATYTSSEFTIGTVNINFPPKENIESALYVKSLLHTSDTTLEALPEIDHKMRAPPKNAPVAVSAFFTLLAIAPVLFFIKYVISLKPDLNRMKTPLATLYGGFVVGICLMYIAYWLQIPGFLFYDTIRYLLVGFPIFGLLGRFATIAVIQARVAEDKQD